ncbi:Aste57867_8353 [Aphanomyces stellatus]|uniref:Aste57867_8353 protein n=1 Tax=Aphanomyces stellatus TaxID=120398 RepID=A0A485KK33_9STRA|nr:hypothetical protein As57867_008321 [Aphanomyces stellatus]VFT85239.1 Aste57867_8353 [Aphanomyces stellatus]
MWSPPRFLAACSLATFATASSISVGETSYVVRLHASTSEALAHLSQDNDYADNSVSSTSALQGEPMPMTSSNGKRYLCYIPLSPDVKRDAVPKQTLSLVEIGREAAAKLKPHCIPTVEPLLQGAFEICHGEGVSVSTIEEGVVQVDSKRKVRERLLHGESVYTQSFGSRLESPEVLVQYACWNSPVTSLIGRRVPNLSSPSPEDHATAFLFGSRWFCLDADAESVADVSVTAFLAPSFENNACVRRTEGWWTYEFCVGDKMSQFHREQNGELTAEFSLGAWDADANAALQKNRKAIVSEFLDDTYDKAQPAVEQMYDNGTPCDEVGRHRSTRVLMFCPALKKQAPYIISIQESSTCSYLLKVAVPSLCDHPYFAREERLRSELLSQTIHCVPAGEIAADGHVTTSTTAATLHSTHAANDEL